MASSQPENEIVGQVGLVGQGLAVPAVSRGGTRDYIESRPTMCPARCPVKPTNKRCPTFPEPWPPAEFALPNSISEIESGRLTQRQLFPQVPDDGRDGRLTRLMPNSTPPTRGYNSLGGQGLRTVVTHRVFRCNPE